MPLLDPIPSPVENADLSALEWEPLLSLVAGFAASAIVGYLAIEVLLRFLRTHSLRPFGVYLGLLGLLLVAAQVFPSLLPALAR